MRVVCGLLLALACGAQPYDVIIRGGTVYDGSGGAGRKADIAIRGDRIAHVGPLRQALARTVIDADGLAVSPGFINMLSHAYGTLYRDGRAQSDVRQGVTTEIMGEGTSIGPTATQGFGAAMQALAKRGLAVNIASFVGATTLRTLNVGYDDRPPTAAELLKMRQQAARAMREGALGIGSSLIYAPAFYAKTPELVALCKAVAPYRGMYISHLRSEGNRLLEALDELISIARQARVPAEVWHLKAGGRENWPKMEQAIAKIEAARKAGLHVSADMYLYEAGSTGLNAAMPPWVQEGGAGAWYRRLRDPEVRARVAREMRTPADDWENLLYHAGAGGTLLLGFRKESLRAYIGKTLSEVAALRRVSPEEAAMDLVTEDESRVDVAYFLMSEDNIRRQVKLPWVSFGSDGGAPSAEGEFLTRSTHPRTYGNFARLLAKYVREEKLIPLPEAIHRMSALPAKTLKLPRRGMLRAGYYADVVIFDPEKVQDHATFADPHRYATGVRDVLVNGIAVLRGGEPTGQPAGRFLRGPGYYMEQP